MKNNQKPRGTQDLTKKLMNRNTVLKNFSYKARGDKNEKSERAHRTHRRQNKRPQHMSKRNANRRK